MDNQQGKTTELELAWLAGFIDGEGCLDFQKGYQKALKRDTYQPRVRINNTDIPTLNKVDDLLRRMMAGHYIYWRHPENKKWKSSWDVEIVGFKKVQRFLIQINPYLYTKKEKAEMLLDFTNSRLSNEDGSGKAPYSEKEVKLLARLRNPDK